MSDFRKPPTPRTPADDDDSSIPTGPPDPYDDPFSPQSLRREWRVWLNPGFEWNTPEYPFQALMRQHLLANTALDDIAALITTLTDVEINTQASAETQRLAHEALRYLQAAATRITQVSAQVEEEIHASIKKENEELAKGPQQRDMFGDN
jgi:hypothetical protein